MACHSAGVIRVQSVEDDLFPIGIRGESSFFLSSLHSDIHSELKLLFMVSRFTVLRGYAPLRRYQIEKVDGQAIFVRPPIGELSPIRKKNLLPTVRESSN